MVCVSVCLLVTTMSPMHVGNVEDSRTYYMEDMLYVVERIWVFGYQLI